MKTTEQKRKALLQLAKRRKKDRLKPHACLADFHSGFYECKHVSPWSISAGNVDAEVMIIGKDWASSDDLEKKPDEDRRRLGQNYSSPTNINLRKFLGHMGLEFSETYATNVFPFIKRGSRSERIPRKDLVYCAKTYTLPQIKIVSPRMAICLGKDAFRAICRAAELRPKEWSKARLPRICMNSVEIYGLPHPASRGRKDAEARSWSLLGRRLQHLRKQDNHQS